MKNIAAELLKLAKDLSASDYSELDPRKVTTLAESIAVGVLGWPKVADVLGNGYEFVLTRLAHGKGLDKVKGLTEFDLVALQGSRASSWVSVVKGHGKRQFELDKAARELVGNRAQDSSLADVNRRIWENMENERNVKNRIEEEHDDEMLSTTKRLANWLKKTYSGATPISVERFVGKANYRIKVNRQDFVKVGISVNRKTGDFVYTLFMEPEGRYMTKEYNHPPKAEDLRKFIVEIEKSRYKRWLYLRLGIGVGDVDLDAVESFMRKEGRSFRLEDQSSNSLMYIADGGVGYEYDPNEMREAVSLKRELESKFGIGLVVAIDHVEESIFLSMYKAK